MANIFKTKTRVISVIFILMVLFVMFLSLYMKTGFVQKDEIDKRDLEMQKFDRNGVIKNAESISLKGSSGKCWVMVHGYTSTPDELRIIANALNEDFKDTVYVPLLDGHGKLPSYIEKYSVDDWYEQVNNLIKKYNCEYLLGSSMGASLVLRYSEQNQDVRGIVLSGVLLKPSPSYLPIETLSKVLLPVSRYLKKTEPGATIDDLAGRKEHISGYSFPIKGAVELFNFDKNVKRDLNKVKADVLFLHAFNDTVADYGSAREAYEEINSKKEFVELKGDHIIFRDYDKEKAINEVLNFRKELN